MNYKLKNKITSSALTIFMLFILTGCSVATTNYEPVNKLQIPPKEVTFVEYLTYKPKKSSIGLGLISVNGNGFASHENLIVEAKKKAAELGGDYILREDVGTETNTVYNPGYTTYNSNGNAYYNSYNGNANYTANGYSVGPSISTYNYPWAIFSVWVYFPSSLGIDIENYTVMGFHLNSDAPLSGVKVGDRILGIDGLDVKDERISQHLMNIMPGRKVNLTLVRNEERIDCQITTLPNF